MPNTLQAADRATAPRGFTLSELMIVLTIVAAMMAMGVPTFYRAIEQSRADIAAANLRAIWAAQRLYWLDNHTYTADIATLRDLGLLDPSLPTAGSATAPGGYRYAVTHADAATFTATATHTNETGVYTIGDSGDVSGAVTVSGATITPGFQ